MAVFICGYIDNGNLYGANYLRIYIYTGAKLFADAMYRVPTFAVSEQLVEGASAGF